MMKKLVFSLAMACCICTQAHVWDELAILARPNGDGTYTFDSWNGIQPSTYTNAIFLDYNNDGLLDLLIMGQGGDWNFSSSERYVLLYKNLGPNENYQMQCVRNTGFVAQTDATFLSPLSAGDYNHDGYTDVLMRTYYDGKAHVDLYLNDSGTGSFTRQELSVDAKTEGTITLADMNADGWLQVVEAPHQRAVACQTSVGDINGDGLLDILCTGAGENGSRIAEIYLAQRSGNKVSYERYNSGLLGVQKATPLIADFNADGRIDLVINGEPLSADAKSMQVGEGYRTRIYYQNEQGHFTLDQSYPIVAVNQDGGINMGDADGDGNMDIVVGGYVGTNVSGNYYSCPLRVYYNRPAQAGLKGNTLPQAPESVQASLQGDSIVIQWKAGSDVETPASALRYNLFVRNETTGEVHSLIPVDTETGQLLVGTDLQVSLSALLSSYTLHRFGPGNAFTIGVQTLDQSWAGSSFTTTSMGKVDHITSTSALTGNTRYYDLLGRPLDRPQPGITIVQNDQQRFKLVRPC